MDETQTNATNKELAAPAEPRGRWCLVANLSKEYDNAARPAGSEHLPPGAKVYVDDFGAWDWDRARIITKGRRRHEWFLLFFGTHWLHNFRAVMEYSPSMRERLDKEQFLGGYDDESADLCRKYAGRGNQKAADFAVGRVTRRHAPPVEQDENDTSKPTG